MVLDDDDNYSTHQTHDNQEYRRLGSGHGFSIRRSDLHTGSVNQPNFFWGHKYSLNHKIQIPHCNSSKQEHAGWVWQGSSIHFEPVLNIKPVAPAPNWLVGIGCPIIAS